MNSIKPSLTLLILIFSLLIVPPAQSQDNNQSITFDSPDGSIHITFGLDDGSPYYSVVRLDSTVIEKSTLVLDLGDSGPQENRFSIIDFSRARGDRESEQPAADMQFNRGQYNEMTFHLAENAPNPMKPVVVFRAYNDGIGFRYELPEEDQEADQEIMHDWTEFNLSGKH